ncbi:hypothetical protein BVRB_034030, partial [Beta vulgaris subsp. vulgaris]
KSYLLIQHAPSLFTKSVTADTKATSCSINESNARSFH